MNLDISQFNKCKVLVVGDLMIDEYLWGRVERISPEAPVPIVSIEKQDYTLGGAGNVVNNIVALGGQVIPVGIIGKGNNGKRLLSKFNQVNIETQGIIISPDRPTTIKTRIIASNQHVLRIDRETKKQISEDSVKSILNIIENRISYIDVVLISDYSKGVITKNLLSKLIRAAKSHKKPIITDPKGLDFSKYSGVDFITPNQKEAGLAAGIDINDNPTLYKAGKKLLETKGIENILITCGKHGMILFQPDSPPYKIESQAKQVFDVSGAGDTVLAVFGLAIGSGASPVEAATLANTGAGIVVGKLGTATISNQELFARFCTPNSIYK